MPLSEEEKRRALAKQSALNKLSGDPYGNDYDYGNYRKYSNQKASNGHMTDQFKMPNHPTFSKESDYSTPQFPGGDWEEIPGNPIPGTPKMIYRPSQEMLNRGTVDLDFLKRYMQGSAENGEVMVGKPISNYDPIKAIFAAINEKPPTDFFKETKGDKK